jgi:Mrp family chromosome partitioning ATPase
MTTNDAAELLPVADHVVLVVAAGQTTAESAARASEILERRGALPLGVAIIGARDMPNTSDYYYDDEDPYLERADTDTSRRRRSERHASETPVDELDPAPAR